MANNRDSKRISNYVEADDAKCCMCKDSSRQLMIATCGHIYCDTCCAKALKVQNHLICKEKNCEAKLLKGSFDKRGTDDIALSIEAKLRKRLAKEVFNFERQDFNNTPKYNDYLETVEDIIYDLSYSNDNINARLQAIDKIEKFKLHHSRQIDLNKTRGMDLVSKKNKAADEATMGLSQLPVGAPSYIPQSHQQPLQHMGVYEEENIQREVWQSSMLHFEPKIAIAGGFNIEWPDLRAWDDVLSGVFIHVVFPSFT